MNERTVISHDYVVLFYYANYVVVFGSEKKQSTQNCKRTAPRLVRISSYGVMIPRYIALSNDKIAATKVKEKYNKSFENYTHISNI